MDASFGPVVIFGSGENAPASRAVYAQILDWLPPAPRLCVLETPAGFEPNSARVAGRVARFLEKHFRAQHVRVEVVPARARGTPFSPEAPHVVAPLSGANLLFLGAGSPTYAVRQLQASLAWHLLQARHRLGAAAVFASAGAVAVSAHTLPIYEIYKVGADLHWQPGLDFFGAYGLNLAIVPHWNNRTGGAGLDTSRCYLGQARFARMQDLLPSATVILGVDEHTALVLDVNRATARVAGLGGVTVVRGTDSRRWETGESLELEALGPFRRPAPRAGLRADAWELASPSPAEAAEQSPDTEVLELVQRRESLRAAGDWPAADAVRRQLLTDGWQVDDTPSGPRVRPVSLAL